MESLTRSEYQQTYNAYEGDIAVLYVYFGQPTTTEYIRVVSLSWVGFLAQAGGLIGACLGFSFISLVEERVEMTNSSIILYQSFKKQDQLKTRLTCHVTPPRSCTGSS